MKMQIVIELSELDYKWITLRKGDETLYPLTLTVYEAIKNGTPLPPHGDLMDRDKIDWFGCTTEEECPYKDRDCKDCKRGRCYKPQVDALPTILEANENE